ncbi:Ribosome biogenesis regulatory protein [Fasciolopsis buskii]|uniref:Ribosome biogenesis regulatory protein n=1 Tax=Fasciolopsis buskii TaxID=27845 RepID=A0A8E0RXY4_9TREM|nr:Ribosome biogenesis regulatory protein [Fasciolopsis buski]
MQSYRIQLAEFDLGNLLCEDKTPLDTDRKSEAIDDHLRDIAYECTHQLLKLLWLQPIDSADTVNVTQLPKPTFRLPREKRIPSQRNLTRWERFARLKGIKNKKKSRKVWDPESKSWRPRWGKDRINNVKDKWVIEVPDNADPYEDQFAKLTKERNERRAKNELQRLRNISRSIKEGQAPPIGVLTESQGSKNELTRALSIANMSDASMGRFSAPLDTRKISKKTEQKVKERMKLSQVVDARSVQDLKRQKQHLKSKKKNKNKIAKRKPMKKKGSRTGNKKS